MSDGELSDTQAQAWGKSRSGSRASSRSGDRSPGQLNRSRSRSRGQLDRLPRVSVGDQALPVELQDQLGELLDDERTRETLVDNMRSLTKEAQQRPIVSIPTDASNYMHRAGSPQRGRIGFPVSRMGSSYKPPRIDYSGFYSEPENRDETGYRRDGQQNDSINVDFSKLGSGRLAAKEQTMLTALATIMVQDLVPKLKDELSAELTHKTLITRERRAGMINAPRLFPVDLVLHDMDRSTSSRYNQYWISSFKKKFNGDPKRTRAGSPDIDYFLNRMNSSQHFFPLSEIEFRDHLQNFTEAPAWNKITSWMYQQLSLQEIYNKLLACYDKREKSHEAIKKLEALRFADFCTWADAETEVERLAMRASLARTSVSGEGQRALFHYLST